MFDPATVLSIALEELVNREGDDIAECDRLHCGDTIGPCRACPIKLDTARGRDDGEA
jgi:hypothetical protein